jgi:hypothetical protein
MLNAIHRPWLVGVVWFATVAVITALSVSMDARWSTTGLLLLIGMTPAIVALLIGAGAPSPTVAEILHAVDAKNGR